MEPPRTGTARWALLAVIGWALFVAWDSGRRGLMPLDHSVAFDGGWRILSGQVPWRDFGAPSFITPSLVQALFFGVFGVTWWSFLLHAMVANAVFAALVFGLSHRLGLGVGVAGALGLASAVVLYPPIGLPFADQEAFLFTFAALYAACAARGIGAVPNATRALSLWAAVPAFLVLGFLSKQLPSSLAPLPLLLVLWLPTARPRREALCGLALGLGLLGVLLLAVGWGLDIELARVRYALFELPMGEADTRLGYMPKGARLVGHFLAGSFQQGLAVVWFVHLGALAAIAGELWRARTEGLCAEVLGLALLGESLLLVNTVTLVLTSNQDGAGVAWFFVAAAPVLAALVVGRGPRVRRWASFALIAVCLADAARFEVYVNLTRSVNDMEFALDDAPSAGARLSELAPLRWKLPARHAYSLDDFAALVAELRAREGDFFLVGDSALLYGLVGKESRSPALWFHSGVSFPARGATGFRAWQTPLVEAIADGSIARIVEERAGTWVGELHLADFPRVAAAARTRGFVEEDFGAFRVLELAPLGD